VRLPARSVPPEASSYPITVATAHAATRPWIRWQALGVLVGCLAGLAVAFVGASVAAGLIAVVAAAACAGMFLRRPFAVVLALWVLVELKRSLMQWAGQVSPPVGALVGRADQPVIVVLLVITLLRGGMRSAIRALGPVLWCGLAFFVAGVSSALLRGVTFSVTLVGSWLALKLWFLLVITTSLPWTERTRRWTIDVILFVATTAAVVAVLEFLAPQTVRHTLRLTAPVEYRAGLPGVQSIFTHPADLSSLMVISFALVLARYFARGHLHDLARLVLFAFAALLTLRLKSIVAIPTATATIALVRPCVARRRAGLWIVMAGFALVVWLGAFSDVAVTQTKVYSDPSTTARGALYATSAQIGRDRFPLGVGFGTYGSYPSRLNYSAVYDEYRLSKTWGLSREFPFFIDDTMWPSVLGESGFAGLLAYLGGLSALAFLALRQARLRSPGWENGLAAVGVFAVLLVLSFGQAVYVDAPTALSLALVIALAARSPDRPVSRPQRRRLPEESV
jgi:hypothetical protein